MGTVFNVLHYGRCLRYGASILSIEWNLYLKNHETYSGTNILCIDYRVIDIDTYSLHRQVLQSSKYNDS